MFLITTNNYFMKTASTFNVGRFFVSTLFATLFAMIGFGQTYTFTNAGATGRFGPTQAQCNTAYGPSVVTINTQGIQEWVVPATGSYRIQVRGAQGASGASIRTGGFGAVMEGDFSLTAGQTLKIVVGQVGLGQSSASNGGGGGGSFVTFIDNTPIIVAGGGGGTRVDASQNGCNAGVSQFAGTGSGSNSFHGCGLKTGSLTMGGISSFSWGSGGGGLIGNGANDDTFGSGGVSFISGAIGGASTSGCGFDAQGGFGGGGAGNGCYGGGGGGGYSGGDGGWIAGAGGSFNSGINQVNLAGANSGMGLVVITNLCSPTTLTADNATLSDAIGFCSVTPTTPTATDDCGNTVNGVPDVAFPITTPGTTVVTWTYTSGAISETQTQDVIVSAPASQTIVPLDQDICINTAASIQILGSQVGVNYFLRNDADNSIVDGPIAGTGADLTFTTGNLAATTVFNVLASGGGACEIEFPVTVTVTVDDTAPVAVCQDLTVNLDATGNASITAAQLDGGSTDFCPVTFSIATGLGLDQFNCSHIGANTITLTVTDNNSNFSTCNATVTIADIEFPTVTCNNFTVVLDATGNAAISTNDIGGSTALDNCGISAVTASITTFTCSDLGDNLVTLTVTDDNGNSTTCDATVTVEDNTPPNAICQPATVVLNASGTGSIVVADINSGSNDNCGIASLSLDITDFSCANVGANTVNLTATDAAGNSASCSATVTVQDNTAPTAICQNTTVQLDAAGNATLIPAQIDNGSNDACGISNLSLDITSFTCANVGANTVELTVTDNNSNSATCTATVTVEDNIAPTALCQNTTIQLDAAGSASIVVADINNGSNDACGIATLSLSQTTFDCSNVGANTVTLTVEDNNGNSATCSGTVTVQDLLAPTALCAPITVSLNGAGTASVSAAMIDDGSSDNCAIASLSVSPNTFNCSNTGVNNVILTVLDVNGNSATCNTTVTVEDTQAPALTCPANITQPAVTDNCGRIINYSVSGSDNCTFTITQTDGTGYSSGDLFPVGTTTQSYQITDASGNSSTCTFSVTIQDLQFPSITGTPGNLTVFTPSTSCNAVASWVAPIASDNCPGVVLTTTNLPGSVFPLGTTTVTYTAVDASGNTTTTSFTVTVIDNIAPLFDCPASIALNTDANECFATVASLGAPTVSDNCSIASVTNDAPGTFPVGSTTITWTATDGSGNVSTCTQDVVVTDIELPTALCQDITIQLNAAGTATITAGTIDNGSDDACGIATVVASQTAFNCSHVGANTVTLTVTDNNGNSATCSSTVTVEDNVAPVALCQDLTVQLNAAGTATIASTDVNDGSNDACGIASLVVSPSTFDCTSIASNPNVVTLTVTDNNGNTATCTAEITVEDNVAPVALCQDLNVQLDASGIATITAAQIDNGSNDACGIASISASQTAFNCSNVGSNTVTLTVTDNNGNTATCSAQVTIEDNVAPVAICQDLTVQLDASGNGSITAADINNGSNDACGILSLVASQTAFDCSNVGLNVIALTVTDNNGNTSTCTSDVIVEDNIAPTITCQDITLPLDATGNVVLDPMSVVASGAGYIVDQTGTFAPVPGVGTPLFLGDDVTTGALPIGFNFNFFGNNYSDFYLSSNGFIGFNPGTVNGCCSGGFLPTAGNPDNIISFAWADINPAAGGAINYFTTGSAPNRQLVLNFNNVPQFANNNPVTTQLVLNESSNIIEIHTTALPSNGNVYTQGIENINGTEAYTVPGRNSANWSAFNDYVTFIPVTALNDACGIASVTADITNFDCSNVGPNTVTITATDVNGNASSCTSTVTIEDVTPPTAICQDLTIQLDALGSASITADQLDNGSTDVCTAVTFAASQVAFDCADLGVNTVVLTVSDAYGNSSTCTAQVTVEDNIAPTITCPADIATVNDPGVCGAVVTFTEPIFDDNCGGSVISLVQNTNFTIFDGLSCGFGGTTNTARVYDLVAEGITGDFDVTSVEFGVFGVNGPVSDQIQLNLYIVPSFPIPTASLPAPIYTETISVPVSAAGTVYTHNLAVSPTIPAGSILLYELSVNSGNGAYPWLVGHNINSPANETQTSYINGSCGVPDYISMAGVGFANNAAIMSINGSQGSLVLAQTAGLPSGSVFPVGTTTNTYVVTDGSGNTATCSFDVTVTDTEAPNAVCNNITINLDALGTASITVTDIDGGSTDNCAIATTSIDITSFDCSTTGANNVELTVTDIYGNIGTCTAIVTVVDAVPPVAVCQDLTIQLDATGNATLNAIDVDNGSSDNCGIASLTVSPDVFTCAEVGANTVTLTVADLYGNTATCTAQVTVEDNVAPIAVCQNLTVQLDATGNATITANDIDNGSNDACGIASLVASQTAFDCSNVGVNTITLTVTDNNGNTSTCTSDVTVEDNIAPIAICQDITVELDATGNASITANDIDNGSNDACGIATLVASETAFDCSDIGANTVTLTVTDVNGNISTCTSLVTVVDLIAPVITCPAPVVVSADPGVCSASFVAIGMATAVDNCSGVTIVNNGLAVYPLGATTVTWTATDIFGNSSTCDQIITVIDSENPVITCAPAITVNNETGFCGSNNVVLASPTVTDNCAVASVTNDAPAFFALGTTTVTWTATDFEGNSSICTQFVTVIDTEAPSVMCPIDVVVDNTFGQCAAIGVVLASPATVDNCSVTSITNDAPLSFPVGLTTVTWTATDAAGNNVSCTQMVTVVDAQAPTAVCPPQVTANTDAASCFATGLVLGSPITADNCGVTSITNDAPASYPLGNSIVTWTIADAAGNFTTCEQDILVLDMELPTIVCAGPLTVNTDAASCEATGIVLGTPTTGDNCTVASIFNNAPLAYVLGVNTVTWTVVDGSGNTATCTQLVTVIDTEAPQITCPATVTVSAGGGSCSATGVALGSPVVSDNCTVASVSSDAPATFLLGSTNVTWTVTDASGNSSTCIQIVTVIDTENPVITCPFPVTVSAGIGTCEATGVALGMATGTDNCSVASITNNAPASYGLGSNTVIWTITDGSGNTATCTQTVTVIDDQAPMISCPGDVTVNAAAGLCSASGVVLGSPMTSDNCSVASIVNNGLSVYPVGTTVVTWMVTDGSGNTATCAQNVTVLDTQAPTIACPVAVTVPADLGLCSASGVALGTPVTTDNCSVATVTNNAPSAFPLGNTTVVWTAVDASGNSAVCTQVVTVIDTQNPTIVCAPAITVENDLGQCSAVVTLVAPITADNCSVASVTNNAPLAFPVGTTTVTWTVLDGSGNSATCTQQVTVIDTELPTINCVNDIVVNNVPGNCGRIVNYAAPTFVDNCAVVVMTQTDNTGFTSGSWFPVGTTLQQYTITDQAGNALSCSFTVTVIDNQAPIITSCPTNMFAYSTTTSCDAPAFWPVPVATDNCPSGLTMTSNLNPGVLLPLGLHTVTYVATDASGNSSTCTFTVTAVDTISPISVSLPIVHGGCAVTLEAPKTTDNCSGDVIGTTTTVFPVTTQGITPVVWTFTDASGNTTTVVQYIEIDGAVDATISYLDEVTLIANNDHPSATYQWTNCETGVIIGGATNQTFTPFTNGIYAVIVTEEGCPSAMSICYEISTVGVEDLTLEELVVYPNPSVDGVFHFNFNGTIEGLDVYDVVGRLVYVNADLNNMVVDGSQLADGKYIMRIKTNQGILVKEVIVNK